MPVKYAPPTHGRDGQTLFSRIGDSSEIKCLRKLAIEGIEGTG